MMYNNKFVVAVKTGGRILREVDDTVYLPFGCEYSLLLKNLNNVRAEVRITIDDEDVLGGNSIVVNANSNVELERYLKDLSKGNRFKFIERSASVEQHRGVGAGDGLVRIEWQYEKPRQIYSKRPEAFPATPWITASGALTRGFASPTTGGDMFYATNASAATNDSMHAGMACSASMMDSMMTLQSVSDVGITVPGSMSSQKFTTVDSFPLEEQTHVMVLQLKGESGDNVVTAPVTVKAKPKCVTCGKVNKATAKFCSNCGTALEIV
jgi:zinc-ribbon domain